MRIVPAAEAIRRVPDGSTVALPQGCAEAPALYAAFAAEVERFRDLTLLSGLSFGDYRFLRRGLGTSFRYLTWQTSLRIRDVVASGGVDYVPIRYGEVHRLVRRGGPIVPDVAVVQVSPPRRGRVSLGISASLTRHFVEEARLVIAEIDPHVPWTAGDSRLDASAIDLAVESDAPLLEYRTPPASARDLAIVDRVLDVVPDRATVQLGVGSVPDRVLERLAEKRGIRLFSGMLSGGLRRFVERARSAPPAVTGELAGDRAFYEWCGRTKRVRMAPSSVTHDIPRLAAFPRFTSVNSTIEVDLQGQANGETIGGVQVSGVGGSLDYVQAAALSAGGVSIVALPSTTEDGKRSRIVARLGEGAVVTTPRYAIDTVVTEYGTARLRGKDLRARAEALIAIAHPGFRDELAAAARRGSRLDSAAPSR